MAAVKSSVIFFLTYDFTASLRNKDVAFLFISITFDFEMAIEGDMVPHGSVFKIKPSLKPDSTTQLKNAAYGGKKKKTLSIPLKWMFDSEQHSCDQVVFSCLPLFSWWLLWETTQPRPNTSRRSRLSTTDRHTVTASKCSFIQLWLFKTPRLACKHDIYWNSFRLNRVNVCQLMRPSYLLVS